MSDRFFPYAFPVKEISQTSRQTSRAHSLARIFGAALLIVFVCSTLWSASPQQNSTEVTPVVTKVEPPSWWVGLTQEVMVLLSGRDLEATHVACNLPSLRVSRTQATAGGNYLFIWLKIEEGTRSGTAVCRITAPKGTTSFELPLAART